MTTLTTPRFDPAALWPLIPIGQDSGYNDEGGVLVNTSADGVDLNTIWADIQAALRAWNAERGALTNLLSFWTTDTASAVPQAVADESFEQASEYGEPESLRAPTSHVLLGYDFFDYDKATRFTWKFLRDASQEQILAQANIAIGADEKLVQGSILQRLFDSTAGENEWGHTVYPLFNADPYVPPAYLGKHFTAPHNHYLVSGTAQVDSGNLELLIREVQHHGFGVEPTSQLVLLCNPAQAEIISSFRVGQNSGLDDDNPILPRHDYIPSLGSPAWLTQEQIMGTQAPAMFHRLKVLGSYGPLFVIQSDFCPEDYLACFATSGPNSADNVIGVRQHPKPQYQGLRQIPGFVNDYPLQDSFFQRSFGTGVRRRGGAAVMQIKESGDYEVPVIPK